MNFQFPDDRVRTLQTHSDSDSQSDSVALSVVTTSLSDNMELQWFQHIPSPNISSNVTIPTIMDLRFLIITSTVNVRLDHRQIGHKIHFRGGTKTKKTGLPPTV